MMKKNSGDLVLHIGMPKTGSTFLQYEVFPKLHGINYSTADIKEFKEFKIKEDSVNLWSDETLLGDPTTGYLSYSKLLDIQYDFSDSRIIIVFRNRQRWVRSIYNQYVKAGGTLNQFNWNQKKFDTDFLYFERILEKLRSMFKNGILVLDFDMLKKDPDVFVKHICDFLDVSVPVFVNRVHGRSLNSFSLGCLRLVNHFFKPSVFYRRIRKWRMRKRLG